MSNKRGLVCLMKPQVQRSHEKNHISQLRNLYSAHTVNVNQQSSHHIPLPQELKLFERMLCRLA